MYGQKDGRDNNHDFNSFQSPEKSKRNVHRYDRCLTVESHVVIPAGRSAYIHVVNIGGKVRDFVQAGRNLKT